METENILFIVIKTLVIVLLTMYFFIAVLIARQVFLMNKAIRTKLVGCLNLIVLLHIVLVFGILLFVIFV